MEKIAIFLAAILLIIHGLMELAALLSIFRSNHATQKVGMGIPQFIFEPLRNNIRLTMLLGLIFGFVRVLAAIGILANCMWAWALGVIISSITLTVMTFYLPIGIVDGVLSSFTLVCLLVAFWGNQPIL